MKRARVAALALAALAACTSSPPAARRSPSPTPAPSRSRAAVAFDARRVIADDRILSQRIGVRVAASASYDRAAAFTAARFASLGYRVVRQHVPIPAGKSEGTPVGAGTADNVIAYPPGYAPSRAHVVVGGHLDTVAPAPGANDNGSGAATVLELARLAAARATKLPAVFVEFAGEERRFPGPSGALFGSRFYLEHLATTERASLRGVLIVDMIGNGPIVLVCHNSGALDRRLLDTTLRTAAALHIPHREEVITRFISDHLPFQRAGVPVSWLYSGDQPSVHTPRDTMNVIVTADLEREGRVAWQTLLVYGG